MPCPIQWNDINKDPRDPGLTILKSITSGVSKLMLGYEEAWLARLVFSNHFMPYAKKNWSYSQCNCADLSEAFQLTWFYVKRMRTEQHVKAPLVSLKVERPEIAGYVITKDKYKLFDATGVGGNVRDTGGKLTGRCYFASHTYCKIGTVYFDPTFDRHGTDTDELIERKLKSIGRTESRDGIRVSTDMRWIYTRRPTPCGPFADSWNEITWQEAQPCRGQIARLPAAERIPEDIWKQLIVQAAVRP